MAMMTFFYCGILCPTVFAIAKLVCFFRGHHNWVVHDDAMIWQRDCMTCIKVETKYKCRRCGVPVSGEMHACPFFNLRCMMTTASGAIAAMSVLVSVVMTFDTVNDGARRHP
jgi:hypothetical protein